MVIDDSIKELGLYALYVSFISPLLGIGIGVWAALQPGGAWVATDLIVRGLTILLPLLIWAALQPPVVGGKKWRKEQAELAKPTPTPAPAYTYVPPPKPEPVPTTPPIRLTTPEEKELARIDAEAKEFNLDPDLVEAQKEQTRQEFGSRNGTH